MSGSADPRIVVLMTTWERPTLLLRAISDVRREADAIGAELVIADDQSKDPATRALLAEEEKRGAVVIRRDYHRSEASQAHACCQRNNRFAFRWILENRPCSELILKVDDDIELADGAFQAMLDIREKARAKGADVAQTSGIQTIYEKTQATGDGYVVTASACNACVIYDAVDWKRILSLIATQEDLKRQFIANGFDWFYTRWFLPNLRRRGRAIATKPSVCYHAGRTGVHTHDIDVNWNYIGSRLEAPST